MDDPQVRTEIIALLAQLERAWCALDFAAVRALWDTERDPIYYAEEADGPLLRWPQLEEYWRITGSAIEHMGMRIVGEPQLRELSPGLVSVMYEMHWDAALRGQQRPIGGDNRVCATLRRKREGWRFAQYVEAPLAPITYVRRLYERSVTPGFPAAR